METVEGTSELQSRLSSLSVSSFPGITSKNWDNSPLDRLQSTDVSQNSNAKLEMDGTNDTTAFQQSNQAGPNAPAVDGDPVETFTNGNTQDPSNQTPPLSNQTPPPSDQTVQMPPLLPPSTWTSPGVKDLKARLRLEKDSMVTVYRGDIMTVHVPTVPEGKQVCWEFTTDGYDIGFGVYFDWTPVTSRNITVHISESSDDEDEDEEAEGPVTSGDIERGSKAVPNSNLGEIMPVYRQDSHLSVHGGSHQFPGEGTYLLKFDNSYSLWRNKTLYYRVYYSA